MTPARSCGGIAHDTTSGSPRRTQEDADQDPSGPVPHLERDRPGLAREDGPAPAPVRLSEAGSGELLRKTPDGLVPLPLLDLQVRLEVTGILVHGVVTQTFRNPTTEVIECVYVFPLPEQAAVHRMEMRIGERRIVSIIREKEEAKQVYEQARQEGRKAGLLEHERPNLFTTSAANANPGEAIENVLEELKEIGRTACSGKV